MVGLSIVRVLTRVSCVQRFVVVRWALVGQLGGLGLFTEQKSAHSLRNQGVMLY